MNTTYHCRNSQAELENDIPRINSLGEQIDHDYDYEFDCRVESELEDVLDPDNFSDEKLGMMSAIIEDEQVLKHLYQILGSNVQLIGFKNSIVEAKKLSNEDSIKLLDPLQKLRARIESLLEEKIRDNM